MLLFHSLSNEYGRAGLSRLSALFGTHAMIKSVFVSYANFLYHTMADFYEEQQKVVNGTASEVVTRQATVLQIDRKVEAGVGYDGTWLVTFKLPLKNCFKENVANTGVTLTIVHGPLKVD